MTTFLKRSITLIACCLVVTTGFAQGSYPYWNGVQNTMLEVQNSIRSYNLANKVSLPTDLQRRRSFQVLATNTLRITIVTI